jgi:hypothetical protein
MPDNFSDRGCHLLWISSSLGRESQYIAIVYPIPETIGGSVTCDPSLQNIMRKANRNYPHHESIRPIAHSCESTGQQQQIINNPQMLSRRKQPKHNERNQAEQRR